MTAVAALPVVRTVPDLRKRVAAWRTEELRVALVPTMGALHEGHLSLVRQARREADRVVATIFVNPRQFGPSEDFSRYPRREAEDAGLLAGAGTDLLFAPAVEAMYPPGFATTVSVAGISAGLCGAARPGHFDGVATVVAKLLLQALPDVALFGEKDYQQLKVIERMVRDLDIPVAVRGVPTVREPDGLALSSRNAYLTPDERAVAPALHRVLAGIADALAAGRGSAATLTARGKAELEAAGFAKVDYLEVRDAETLVAVETAERPVRVLAAAWLGRARLIDNVPVPSR